MPCLYSCNDRMWVNRRPRSVRTRSPVGITKSPSRRALLLFGPKRGHRLNRPAVRIIQAPPADALCPVHPMLAIAPCWMSGLGQKQTFAVHQPMSALPPIATLIAHFADLHPATINASAIECSCTSTRNMIMPRVRRERLRRWRTAAPARLGALHASPRRLSGSRALIFFPELLGKDDIYNAVASHIAGSPRSLPQSCEHRQKADCRSRGRATTRLKTPNDRLEQSHFVRG
jgi:hypothetical protein